MLKTPPSALTALACAWLCVGVATAQTAGEKKKDSELDALELTAEPAKSDAAAAKKPAATPSRLAFEASVGRYVFRDALGDEDTHRFSIDWRYSARLNPRWRAVISNRFDHIKPADGDRSINTLREAFLGWQSEDATNAVEFGRINMRNGVGYGYNPTDFFRDGSLRTTTTLDPVALRDARMGSVAVRAQRLWAGGGVSFVLSPKLDDKPDRDGASLDLGSTNHSTRAQIGWSHDLAGGVSLQLLGLKQTGESMRLGANLTALLSESVVLHAEAAHGRAASLVDRAFATPAPKKRRASQLASGVTAALPASFSVTAEVQYNGFALSENEFAAIGRAPGAGVPALNGYLAEADRLQDSGSRRAFLLYLSKKDLGLKDLDLTAFVRTNLDDKSRLIWAELRKELGARSDIAIQWQQLSGKPLSELGVLPLRRSFQLVFTVRL